jgi:hypothetical protein
MNARRIAAAACVVATALLGAASGCAAAEPVYTVTGTHEIAGTVRACAVSAYEASYEAQHTATDFRPTIRVTTSKDRLLAEVRVDDEGRFAVPLRFDGRYTVIAYRNGCADRVLARIPRGSALTVALEPFVWRDRIESRSLCGAYQPGQPVLTYVVSTYCHTGIQ